MTTLLCWCGFILIVQLTVSVAKRRSELISWSSILTTKFSNRVCPAESGKVNTASVSKAELLTMS